MYHNKAHYNQQDTALQVYPVHRDVTVRSHKVLHKLHHHKCKVSRVMATDTLHSHAALLHNTEDCVAMHAAVVLMAT